ncbi:hypothetical protein llap_13136 [Limosa lapponica baueri]|uniref:G-protein coupled receptors family 1 profile domain-containing protein n=1 Tax=Limosa lapponica baueri TaxID=1758121 RepID=A0A2I0TRZ4_LIMLA|nr:hypothetical protein llap_13136 [Limosa lapponica baueri]
MLGSIMQSYTLTPHDCKTLVQLILTGTQYTLWEAAWKRLLEAKQLEYLDQGANSPGLSMTIDHLMGTGDYKPPYRQDREIPRPVLDDVKYMAYRAFLEVPELGKPQKSFTEIKQGTKETYMGFIDRLQENLDKQVPNEQARNIILLKLAVENAKTDCQCVLCPLQNPNLIQMIEACNRIGTKVMTKPEWKNKTVVTEFILLGFGNGPELDSLLLLMFLLIYIATITGNILIIVLVVADRQLHTPMYFFLGNLACLEICYSSNILPRMLLSYLGGDRSIPVNGCFTQYYFFGCLAAAECYLLAVMFYHRASDSMTSSDVEA